MRFRPVVVGALLVLLLAGAVAASAAPEGAVPPQQRVGDEVSATAVDSVESGAVASTTGPFDRADPGLVITIQLQENGDARWHITHRFVVNGSNETAAFEEFATAVKAGERNVGTTKATFSRFAESASEATGREMSIEDAGWSSSRVANGTGEISYSFTWMNFGRVDGELLRVGDAFQSPNGTWFPRLYDGQRLVIKPPSSLAIVGTPPDKGVTDRALVWDGYREFDPGYLTVVLDTRENTATTNGTDGLGDGDLSMSPFLLGVGFALLLVLVGVGSYLFARRQTIRDEDGAVGTGGSSNDDGPGGAPGGGSGATDGRGASDAAADDPDSGAAGGGSAATAGRGDESVGGGVAGGNSAVTAEAPETAAEDAGDATSASGDTAGAEEAAAGGGAAAAENAATEAEAAEDESSAEDDGIDESLLSDEERVLRLLDQNGGRMKQANIVTETGWSNAKVSQLLSGMAEEEAIQKLRIGRENLITLPDENVGDFGNDDE